MATIFLFKSVPWSEGGYHVLRFPSATSQENYFNNLDYTIFNDVDYEPRPGANLNLPINYTEANKYTYLIYESDEGARRHFFIRDYEYLNDNPTTRFIIAPDYWQDHHINLSLAPGAVHRRHMPRWSGSTPVFYPVDEGGVRSETLNSLFDVGQADAPENGVYPALLITNKPLIVDDVVGDHDGIYYYLTWCEFNGVVSSPGGKVWMNPLDGGFGEDFAGWGKGLAVLVGAYLIPVCGILHTNVEGYASFPDSLGYQIDTTDRRSLYYVRYPELLSGSFNVNVSRPTRNTTTGRGASDIYEPMMYAESIQQVIITDQYGRQMISVPKDLLYNGTGTLYYSLDIFSLTPQVRLKWGSSMSAHTRNGVSNGLECAFGCTPLDIPQSAWQDYLFQAQSADKQILENNISTRYQTSAISALTGTASSGAMGAAFGGPFGAVAGLAGGAIGAVGSLATSYIQAGTDRDNFKLNEQKIRNTPTPPIAGNNPLGVINSGGIRVYELIGDQTSRDIIFSQYQHYGYIVDKSMEIPLRTRYYYDYIQTRDSTVLGEMTNTAKSYLESLFNRGITIWHSEAGSMYNYNYDNIEV